MNQEQQIPDAVLMPSNPQSTCDTAREHESLLARDLGRDKFNKNAKLVNVLTESNKEKRLSSYYTLYKDLPPISPFSISYHTNLPEAQELGEFGSSDDEAEGPPTTAETQSEKKKYPVMEHLFQ